MKKLRNLFAGSIIFLLGCTAQAPVSEAPVYNVTVTDNSQYVIGDNNKAESRPDTTAKPVAKPETSAQAKNKGNNLWLFWFGFLLGACSVAAGYLVYLRHFRKGIDGWAKKT